LTSNFVVNGTLFSGISLLNGSIAFLISEILFKRGHSVALYHSQLGGDSRRENLKQFKKGMIEILVCCRALDEGVDIPESEVAIIAASTSSNRQRIQRVGRVIRLHGSKDIAKIFTIYITQKELEKLVEEAKKAMEENKKNQEEFSERSEEMKEKQEKLEEPSKAKVRDDLRNCTKEVLNSFCKENGLRVGGTKKEVMDRVWRFIQEESSDEDISPRSEKKKKEKKVVEKHECCGKTAKGSECQVIAEDEPISGKYYCWRHAKSALADVKKSEESESESDADA
jgi:superfamily II DNA or RNA helicase